MVQRTEYILKKNIKTVFKPSSKIKVARCETPVSSENDIITFFWSQGRLIYRDLSNRYVCQTCYQCFLEQDYKVHVALQHDG